MNKYKNIINNIANLSSTGYGVNNNFPNEIKAFLEKCKNQNKQIRVLDFGCSKKPYEYLFCGYNNVVEYIGIDVYNGNKVDIVYDGDEIPFIDEYFDLVFSSSVLEHIENLDNTLSEVARVLKYGGLTIHSVPFINHLHGTPFDFNRISYFGWKSKFKSLGFNKIIIKNSDNRFCCLINMLTAQFNFFLIKIVKIILNKKEETNKDIKKGDASPENEKSLKLSIMYFFLKLNPINFLLGLMCFISNTLPSNKDKEGEITSAYIIKAIK